jgi:hypothetical protein
LKEKINIFNDQKDKALKDREEFAKEARDLQQELQNFSRGVGNNELIKMYEKEKKLKQVESARVQDLLH